MQKDYSPCPPQIADHTSPDSIQNGIWFKGKKSFVFGPQRVHGKQNQFFFPMNFCQTTYPRSDLNIYFSEPA